MEAQTYRSTHELEIKALEITEDLTNEDVVAAFPEAETIDGVILDVIHSFTGDEIFRDLWVGYGWRDAEIGDFIVEGVSPLGRCVSLVNGEDFKQDWELA